MPTTRSSLSIITEFLRSPDPQQRRNALTALAALPSTESSLILAETALTDADRSVRMKAQAEIERLDPGQAGRVAAHVSERFSTYELRTEAYGLLGRLRNRGIPFPMPRLGWMTKLRLATSIGDLVTPGRDLNFRFRLLVPSLVACAIGLVLLAGLAFAQGGFGANDSQMSLAALSFSAIAGVLVSQKNSDLDLQLVRTAAVIIETSRAFIFAGLAGLVSLLLIILVLRGVGNANEVVKFFAKACVLGGVVRLGTLAGWGAFGRRTLVSEVLAGWSVGMLFLTVTPLVLGGVDNDYAGWSWAILVPVSVALSYVFAKGDVSARAPTPFLGRAGVLAASLAGVVLVSGVVVAALPEGLFDVVNRARAPQDIEFINRRDYGRDYQTQLLPAIEGATFRFQVHAPGFFDVKPVNFDYNLAFGLELSTADGRIVQSNMFLPTINYSAEPGRYQLRVLGSRARAGGLVLALRATINAIRVRVFRQEPIEATRVPAMLEISLRSF